MVGGTDRSGDPVLAMMVQPKTCNTAFTQDHSASTSSSCQDTTPGVVAVAAAAAMARAGDGGDGSSAPNALMPGAVLADALPHEAHSVTVTVECAAGSSDEQKRTFEPSETTESNSEICVGANGGGP